MSSKRALLSLAGVDTARAGRGGDGAVDADEGVWPAFLEAALGLVSGVRVADIGRARTGPGLLTLTGVPLPSPDGFEAGGLARLPKEGTAGTDAPMSFSFAGEDVSAAAAAKRFPKA